METSTAVMHTKDPIVMRKSRVASLGLLSSRNCSGWYRKKNPMRAAESTKSDKKVMGAMMPGEASNELGT